uniref:Uncharacterized protein n=1 Tax=Noccaea caerulescens TaxID=107243 RepID=A0A1J3K9A0_NOCCA
MVTPEEEEFCNEISGVDFISGKRHYADSKLSTEVKFSPFPRIGSHANIRLMISWRFWARFRRRRRSGGESRRRAASQATMAQGKALALRDGSLQVELPCSRGAPVGDTGR